MERHRRALEKTGGVMSLFDSDDAPPIFMRIQIPREEFFRRKSFADLGHQFPGSLTVAGKVDPVLFRDTGQSEPQTKTISRAFPLKSRELFP